MQHFFNFRVIGILINVTIIAFLSFINALPLFVYVLNGKNFDRTIVPDMIAQFFTLGSILSQLLFRLYLRYKMNTKEKSTEVLSTKIVLAIALAYIATSIFGIIFGITIGGVVFFLGKYFLLALFTLFSHEAIRNQFLAKYPKLKETIQKMVDAPVVNENVPSSISNFSTQQSSSQRQISNDSNISSPPEQVNSTIIFVKPARPLSPHSE